jgi:hypothetical protein
MYISKNMFTWKPRRPKHTSIPPDLFQSLDGSGPEQNDWQRGGPNVPVYSVKEVTEEVVEAFSQSFSPFLLFDRLGERKPSAESGLKHTHIGNTHTDTHTCRKHIHTQRRVSSRFTMATRFFTLSAYERCQFIIHGCSPFCQFHVCI